MNRRTLVVLPILVIAGGAAWWLFQPPAPAPVKVAEAPKPTAPIVVAPKPAMMQVAAPVVAPAPKPTEAPKPAVAATTADKSDPQAELSTSIDDIIGLLQGGNFMALFDKYASPDDKAKMPPEEKAQMEQQMSQMTTQPEGQMMIQMMTAGFQSIKDQPPQMNAAGDEATYQMTMTPPAGMGPADMPSQSEPMTFVKVDGKWYIKDGP